MIPSDMAAADKVSWRGEVLSVQPRIRLTRSFDERSHEYLGYSLRLYGKLGDEDRAFTVAVGKAAQDKHGFRVGMEVSGQGQPVVDGRRETADLYKASRVKVLSTPPEPKRGPPWTAAPPELPVYRQRGHRRLAKRTFDGEICRACIWGCEMPVEMIIDHWNPGHRRYRTETFCYGPKSCKIYRAGPTRKVPGRKGMTYTEEDWVDEDATSHREDDD